MTTRTEGEPLTLGSDCLSLDPLFISINPGNPANDNYHLSCSPLSPCIDQGPMNGAAPYNVVPTLDMDRNSRPDVTNETTVDMGAYEASPSGG